MLSLAWGTGRSGLGQGSEPRQETSRLWDLHTDLQETCFSLGPGEQTRPLFCGRLSVRDGGTLGPFHTTSCTEMCGYLFSLSPHVSDAGREEGSRSSVWRGTNSRSVC